MPSADLDQAAHVVSGYSAAGLLRQALRFDRERLFVTEDPLSCGPAPATDDLDRWRSTREPFLKALCNSHDPPPEEYDPKGLNTDLLGREESIVVWAGIGLPEQLLLARLVVLFEQLALDPSRLRVVQFEESIRGYIAFVISFRPLFRRTSQFLGDPRRRRGVRSIQASELTASKRAR